MRNAPCVLHRLTQSLLQERETEPVLSKSPQTACQKPNPGISLSRVKPNPCHHRRPLAPAKAFRRMNERFRGDEVFPAGQ